jgi:hypothetical protein
LANTGGGGGGSGFSGGTVLGGSGLVVLRYPSTYPAAASASVSPTTSGGYRYYTFTSGGTITW